MPPQDPPWLAHDPLAETAAPDFETFTALGRLLLTTRPSHRLLRREARARLDALLRDHGAQAIARHWEGRLDVLRALRDATLVGEEPIDRFNAAAMLHARHELHAVRAALLRVAMALPPMAAPVQGSAATLASSMDLELARFDAEVEPWHSALRRALRGAATDPQEALWIGELLDARAPGANPWWIDLADPILILPARREPVAIGLGATLEAGREYANWTFERRWRLVLFADALGVLVASLRDLPADVDASRLSVSWLDGATTHRVAFRIDEWGEVSAHTEASILTSEVVALRDGERFLHRRDTGAA